MYCKGSAFFIITSKYKVESIVLSKSFDISYNYYPPQNTIAELSILLLYSLESYDISFRNIYSGCNKVCKSHNSLIYTLICGERGIRTPGTSRYGSFQDCCNRPLYHLSFIIEGLSGKAVQR